MFLSLFDMVVIPHTLSIRYDIKLRKFKTVLVWLRVY